MPTTTLNRMTTLVEMTHPRAVMVFTLSSLLVAVVLVRGFPPLSHTVALLFAMACVQIAIGVLNEYYDRDLDAVAKPERAIPSGVISAACAYWIGWLALVLGLSAAATLGWWSLVVLTLGAALGIVYSAWLKRSLFSWLPYVLAYPLVPLWVCVSVDKFTPALLLLYPLGLPFCFGIHLCNQLRDFDDDARQEMPSLVQYLGKATASRLCMLCVLSSPVPLLAWILSQPQHVLPVFVSAVLYWLLLAPVLMQSGYESEVARWRQLFTRLRYSGLCLLGGWLITVSA
jgi:4-hydroxybenzoate polyprenyltransferase